MALYQNSRWQHQTVVILITVTIHDSTSDSPLMFKSMPLNNYARVCKVQGVIVTLTFMMVVVLS